MWILKAKLHFLSKSSIIKTLNQEPFSKKSEIWNLGHGNSSKLNDMIVIANSTSFTYSDKIYCIHLYAYTKYYIQCKKNYIYFEAD